MSTKFSARRATPNKPPICRTRPPIPPQPSTICHAHVIWTSKYPLSNPAHIDQTIQLDQQPTPPHFFRWFNPDPDPHGLIEVDIQFLHTPALNNLIAWLLDTDETYHDAETDFTPPRVPPFTQTLNAFQKYAYPDDYIKITILP
jgi:hypothetical protein